jgi:hypothetical protein
MENDMAIYKIKTLLQGTEVSVPITVTISNIIYRILSPGTQIIALSDDYKEYTVILETCCSYKQYDGKEALVTFTKVG